MDKVFVNMDSLISDCDAAIWKTNFEEENDISVTLNKIITEELFFHNESGSIIVVLSNVEKSGDNQDIIKNWLDDNHVCFDVCFLRPPDVRIEHTHLFFTKIIIAWTGDTGNKTVIDPDAEFLNGLKNLYTEPDWIYKHSDNNALHLY